MNSLKKSQKEPIQHIEIVLSPSKTHKNKVDANQLIYAGMDGKNLRVRKAGTTPKRKARHSHGKNRRKDIFTTGKKTPRGTRPRTKSPYSQNVKNRSRTPNRSKSKKKVAKNLFPKSTKSKKKLKKKSRGKFSNASVTMKSYDKVNYDEIFGECRVLGTLDGEYEYEEEDTPGFNLSQKLVAMSSSPFD